MWQKKRVWQVTTIIQLALCHLVTSHFQEIACNYTPKGQIRWPIFLLLLCMIVLTEITSKFPKPIIFRILVFSCHKMTLITIITRMPLELPKNVNLEPIVRGLFLFLAVTQNRKSKMFHIHLKGMSPPVTAVKYTLISCHKVWLLIKITLYHCKALCHN